MLLLRGARILWWALWALVMSYVGMTRVVADLSSLLRHRWSRWQRVVVRCGRPQPSAERAGGSCQHWGRGESVAPDRVRGSVDTVLTSVQWSPWRSCTGGSAGGAGESKIIYYIFLEVSRELSDQIRCCVALTEADEVHIYDAGLFSLSTAEGKSHCGTDPYRHCGGHTKRTVPAGVTNQSHEAFGRRERRRNLGKGMFTSVRDISAAASGTFIQVLRRASPSVLFQVEWQTSEVRCLTVERAAGTLERVWFTSVRDILAAASGTLYPWYTTIARIMF